MAQSVLTEILLQLDIRRNLLDFVLASVDSKIFSWIQLCHLVDTSDQAVWESMIDHLKKLHQKIM